MENYINMGIYYVDLHAPNVLENKKNNIILCDLDNIHVDDYTVDAQNKYLKKYLKVFDTVDENTVHYMFNILTLSYYYNISYANVLEHYEECKLTGKLASSKNKEILGQLITIEDYQGEVLIDNVRKRKLF